MVKSLFRKDDHLLKFYEQKYKFQPKDIRPFAQFDANNDTNTAHDDQMFKEEMEKIQKKVEETKKQEQKRFRDLKKTGFKRHWLGIPKKIGSVDRA